MKNLAVALLIVFLSGTAVPHPYGEILVQQNGACPIKGQVFQQCRTCPATCNNPDLQCTLQCIEGCGCPLGQLIDTAGNKCVQPTNCPKITDSNMVKLQTKCHIKGQVFQECRTCPATCTYPDLQCTQQCIEGCGCPFGQLIDTLGNKCVDPSNCPKITGNKLAKLQAKCPIKGQVFQQCRTCPATCTYPDLQCTQQCIEGCGCPFGQLIDTLGNKCVDPRNCPKIPGFWQ